MNTTSFFAPRVTATKTAQMTPDFVNTLTQMTETLRAIGAPAGAAIVAPFGALRDSVVLPIEGVVEKHIYLSTNCIETGKDTVLDEIRQNMRTLVSRGGLMSVTIELLSPLAHSELMMRVGALRDYGRLINTELSATSSLTEDRIYLLGLRRFKGPKLDLFRSSYHRACEDRKETIRKAINSLDEAKILRMPATIQFVDEIDRPVAYSLTKTIDGAVTEAVVEGSFPAGELDVQNVGYMSSDPMAIRSIEMARLFRLHSGTSSEQLIQKGLSQVVCDNAKREFEMLRFEPAHLDPFSFDMQS